MPERFLASVLPQHETAELFRLMVTGIRECGVVLMDPDGVITLWNKAAEEMLGYTADEALGAGLDLLYSDTDRDQARAEHDLAVAARVGFITNEDWLRARGGRLFWAHATLTALRDAGGQLLGYSNTILDLTRFRQLEQCERERHEIELVLRAAQCGLWKWNIERDEVAVSRQLRELLGYDANARTMRFGQWLPHVHGEDRRRIEAQLAALRADPRLAPLETELRFAARDGSSRWFFLRANWEQHAAAAAPVLVGACVDIDNRKQAENEKMRLYHQLRQERARFANILEQLPSGVVLAEAPSGKLTYQNRAAAAMLGRGIDGIDSYQDYGSFAVYDAKGRRVRTEDLPLTQALLHGTPATEELVYERGDGKRLHFAVTTALIVDHDGGARTAVAVMQDVTELKRAQLSAATEKERALVTLAAITDGVVTLGRDGVVTSMNPSAERLLGCSEASALGRPVAEVLAVDEPGGEQAIQDAVLRCQQERRVIPDLPHLTLHGRGQRYSIENAVAPVTLADGELIGAVLVMHDVTESKRLVRRLGFEASHDSLTGLVNRREFELRLKRALDRSHQEGSAGSALLYMDLDQFKIVNDTCGHSAGDDLLRLLAQSYAGHVRERDTLARIGGDEFALIVEHCDVEEALGVAYKMLDATRDLRYACKGRMFQLGVSIGVTPIDTSIATVEEALRRADHACYIAKERGRNRAYVHDTSDNDFAQRRSDMHWVTRLAHAFDHNQLQLYWQPIVPLEGLGDGAARHYEILLRLGAGGAEPIGPASFLPAAERYDVILKIDRWVLANTLDWLQRNRKSTDSLDMCSINLSRRSLGDQSFHKFAADLIDRSDVPPEKLCFEITENGAIADMNKTTAFIRTLSARGCRFSLDDFGSGMTSLSYLKELPVDYIKIDGAFIQMMSSSEVDYEMVRFTNEISHMMGRKTIAEYVSDPAILGTLNAIGVDYVQGFWLGKPRPLSA